MFEYDMPKIALQCDRMIMFHRDGPRLYEVAEIRRTDTSRWGFSRVPGLSSAGFSDEEWQLLDAAERANDATNLLAKLIYRVQALRHNIPVTEESAEDLFTLVAWTGFMGIPGTRLCVSPALEALRRHPYYFLIPVGVPRDLAYDAIGTMAPGSRLYVMHDLQNEYDPNALRVRTESGVPLGYLPRAVAHWVHMKNPPVDWSQAQVTLASAAPLLQEPFSVLLRAPLF